MCADKDEAIARIARVLREEDFPLVHLRAIATIVNLFNWSEQTEREVFEFARRFQKKYGSSQ